MNQIICIPASLTAFQKPILILLKYHIKKIIRIVKDTEKCLKNYC